jgi:pyruvate dehydrogenase E1 component alpha subunit
VAFFGDGAMNQGMLMESMNLASVWNLPVLFVCKDDGWAITTQSVKMTGGDLNQRAQGLGVAAVEVDGRDVSAVWEAAQAAIERACSGRVDLPACDCVHFRRSFLLPIVRMVNDPLREMPGIAIPLTQSVLRPAVPPGAIVWQD